MELDEVKDLVETYYFAGKTREETVVIVSALSMNGQELDALEYVDLIYKKAPAGSYNLTDAGNGEAIAFLHRPHIRYVYEWKNWIIYDSGKWSLDTDGLVRRLTIETMRRLFFETDADADPEQRKKTASWYIGSEGDKRIGGALNLAACQIGITITADMLDAKPWLLNLKNGTYDLDKCELREANPGDLLTKQIDINYNPDAKCDEWANSFLTTIFEDNHDLIEYLQRGIGFTLNGTQLERVFFFLYGLGRNGKSQFMDALRYVLGPYAMECKPELFMESKYSSSGPDEGQAALNGVRLLTSSEIKRGQNLDVSLIKRMTGSEPLWHEKKFQHGFSFKPTHTLWLAGNHEPRVKDTTDSIWDRLNKIPFDVRITAENEVKGYGLKLAKENSEAILNWCIQGAIAWKDRGLSNPPECVTAANEEYRARQDVLHDFLECRVVKIFDSKVLGSDMYKAYEEFCRSDEIDPIAKKSFNEAMRERGYKEKTGHANKKEWRMVSLVSPGDHIPETFLPRAREGTLGKTVTQGNLTNQSGEMPDCPECKKYNWKYLPDGEKVQCLNCGFVLNDPIGASNA